MRDDTEAHAPTYRYVWVNGHLYDEVALPDPQDVA